VERWQRAAHLGGVEAPRHAGPGLDEVERAHAVHGHVVDARAQHHAAALEERHLHASFELSYCGETKN
jgi:hypothetical protein